MKRISLISALAASSAWINAQAAEQAVVVPPQPEDVSRQQDSIIAARDVERPSVAAPVAVEAGQAEAEPQQVTLADLENDPELTEYFLNQALMRQQWAEVAGLFDIYRTFPQADPILLDYAEGALLRVQRQHKQAIEIYRKLIADHPELNRIRLDLAIMLFEDKQYVAAREQFQRVRASEDMQPDVELIDQYLERIQKEVGWDFDIGLSYLKDDNLNNASSSKTIRVGNAVLTKKEESLPKSGAGIRYSASAERDFNISGSHYFNVEGNVNGRYVFNDKELNDENLRLYAGYHYQDANVDFKLRPTFAIRYYGGDHYTNTLGVAADTGYWISPQFRLSGSASIEHEKDVQDQSSSNSYSLGVGGFYATSADRYFFGGINADHTRAIGNRAASHTTLGARFGWGEDWSYGISTRLSGNYARKSYLAENQVFQRKRKDDISGVQLAIWNRDWYFWGITPKLNFSTHSVDSNIPDLYSYDKKNVYLQFDKTF